MRDHLVTDLATAVSKPPRKPATAGQVRRSSATLITWNAAELRGSVDWNGTVIHDVPVLGALDAFSWVAGDEVVIDTVPGTSGGFSSPMILGRVFRPGAENAARVLQGLQNEFALQVAEEIAAANIYSITTLGAETRADTSGFQELPGGPEIQVPVSNTGKVVVHLSSSILGGETTASPGAATAGGRMGVALSGANVVAASADRSVAILGQVLSGPGTDDTIQLGGRFGTTFDIGGLTPGMTTFTAMYARLFVGDTVDFTDRTIVVQRS